MSSGATHPARVRDRPPLGLLARRYRPAAATPLIGLVLVVWGILECRHVGLSLRDPDHDAAIYLVLVGAGVALLACVDVVLRAGWRPGRPWPARTALRSVREERWTRERSVAVGLAVAGFYLAYMAYRNIKSIVPLLRPGVNFDPQLRRIDRDMAFGHDPATLLHSVFGTGIFAHVFSTAYVGFIVFLPLTIGVTLVFGRDVAGGLAYACAQSINWILGAVSYILLPALGPCYAFPKLFSALPRTEAGHLQGVLLDQRVAFLANPAHATPQEVAAFASLHCSMSFTAVLAAHVFGASTRLRAILWAWLVTTLLGTCYLGWHYVIDDVAGFAMGAVALAGAMALTGLRRSSPAPA